MVNPGRFALAAVLAPLAAPALIVLAVLATDGGSAAGWFNIIFFVALAASYAAFITLGLPVLLLLRSHDALNAINVIGAGTGLGVVLGTGFQIFLPGKQDDILGLDVSSLIFTAISAFVVALVFVIISGAWRSPKERGTQRFQSVSRGAVALIAGAVITAAQFAKDTETIVLRILVVNEAGEPVPGAAVRGFFFVEQVQREDLDGNVAGFTGQDGRVEIDGIEDIYVDVQVDKDGYYRSTRRVLVRNAEIREHGSDQTIRLRKQIDPIAMYVKQLVMASENAGSKPHGYDLVLGDFVEPLGRGSINDLVITFDHKPGSTFDWSWTHSVTFSNPGDGLIPVKLNEPDSEFKSAYRAPEDGYLGEWLLEMSRTDMNEAAKGNTDPNRSYYFRIRTLLEPNGGVSGGHYGKIYGELPRITYYLNPEAGNRNVEWDVARNLLDPLPILNRATAP